MEGIFAPCGPQLARRREPARRRSEVRMGREFFLGCGASWMVFLDDVEPRKDGKDDEDCKADAGEGGSDA